MSEDDIAEYVEKMKDKPKKQTHHPNYKPEWHFFPEPMDMPILGMAVALILCYIFAFLGVL